MNQNCCPTFAAGFGVHYSNCPNHVEPSAEALENAESMVQAIIDSSERLESGPENHQSAGWTGERLGSREPVSGSVAELVKRADDLLSWVKALRESVDAFNVHLCYWPIEACTCGECGGSA